jgi:protein involved in polysaccharide export with SLBB domain
MQLKTLKTDQLRLKRWCNGILQVVLLLTLAACASVNTLGNEGIASKPTLLTTQAPTSIFPSTLALTTTLNSIPVVSTPPPPVYRLQSGDEIELRFDDNPELNQTFRIPPDGRLNLPNVGVIDAGARSLEQLQQELYARYAALLAPDQTGRYLLNAGDDIELKFTYTPDLNELVKIRPDGFLQLQLIGAVRVLGMTPEQVHDLLVQRYARYVRRPEVVVIVRKTVSQNVQVGDRLVRADINRIRPTLVLRSSAPMQVFVGGEVLRPGALVYRSGLTLLAAIIEAGGRLPTSQLRNVLVLRKATNEAAAKPIVFERDLMSANPQDLALEPADIILIPQTRIASISEMLNEYVFKILPFVRNSSFSYVYDIRKQP